VGVREIPQINSATYIKKYGSNIVQENVAGVNKIEMVAFGI
jgi:hypothetical protein